MEGIIKNVEPNSLASNACGYPHRQKQQRRLPQRRCLLVGGEAPNPFQSHNACAATRPSDAQYDVEIIGGLLPFRQTFLRSLAGGQHWLLQSGLISFPAGRA